MNLMKKIWRLNPIVPTMKIILELKLNRNRICMLVITAVVVVHLPVLLHHLQKFLLAAIVKNHNVFNFTVSVSLFKSSAMKNAIVLNAEIERTMNRDAE